nr:hypothetical protein [Tanacetum cinerariifolium]
MYFDEYLGNQRDPHLQKLLRQRKNPSDTIDPDERFHEDIRNTKAYKEYYACATGEAAPKPKASARRKKGGSDSSTTPPTPISTLTPISTVVAAPRLTAAAKGKQPARATSPTNPSEVKRTEAEQLKIILRRSRQETHISQHGGFSTDEGTGSKPGVLDVPSDDSEEEISWNSSDDEDVDAQDKDIDDVEGKKNDDNDDEEEIAKIDKTKDTKSGGDDEETESDGESEEDETKEEAEESFDSIPRIPKDGEDDGDGEKDQGLRISEEERIYEEEEADELYRDVDINQGKGLQVSQDIEDSHVTLTPVHSDGQQESLLTSSFVTSLLNPIIDPGMESIFTTALSSVAPLPLPTSTMTPSIITTTTTASQPPIPPTPIPKEQQNLYKALVEAYEADKTILDSYGESAILKRKGEDDDDQEGPFARSDWGSKRRREGGEHASASTPSEPATRSTGRSTTGTQSRQMSASESALAEEPPRKPPTPDCDWNKTLPVVQGSAQSWISELAKQADARSSFNELLDTPLDFSNFIMNRLGVDTLTPELLAGLTYELMRGSCNSLTELEYHLEEVYKATTDQLDWVNPKGQQYPHNLLQPLPLIPDNRGRRVILFAHFINNDLEYLRGGASSRKYTTSVTKTNAADYGHIKWIKELVPRTMWIQEQLNYDKHALWGVSHLGRKRQQFYGFAINQESALDVYSKRRIIAVTDLKIVEWHNYKHLDWISVRRDDDQIYKFKEDDFKRLRLQDIEDMLLLLVQGKLSNLTVEERFVFNVSLRMFTRSIVIQRRMEDLQLGVKSYQKRLNLTKPDTYRSDLKRLKAYTSYSDGTLNDVRNALDDRLKGIKMQYLPTTIWRKGDKDRAAAMIQAIDKMLKTRRIMRSLERMKSLEANFSEYIQTNPFAEAVSNILDRLRDSYQRENDEFLRTIDDNMKRIIKERVKGQVKEQVSRILPRIEQSVNAQLEAEVLTRNLYKALVEAYEADKIILDTYGETVTLKRRRDDESDKDEGPSARSDRGSKRRREGKEPESASAPLQTATRSAGAEDQPIVQSSQHPEWFSQPKKPPTPDRDLNKTLPTVQGSTQTWISDMEKQTDSRSS